MSKRMGALGWIALVIGLAAFFFITFRTYLVGGIAVGDPLPQVRLTRLDGTPIDLEAWRGKGVVLRFSSADCVSCADDISLLQQWQERFGDDVRMVAVQVGDGAPAVRAALMGRDVDIPILLDRDGAVARALGVKTIPALYFITARGTLSAVVNSEVTRADLPRHAATMLAGGPDLASAVKQAALQLRCQECDGRSVWESNAPSSIDTRQKVREMLLRGQRTGEVLADFESKYGAWILMAPPVRGFASLAWTFPIGVTCAGIGLWVALFRRAKRSRRRHDRSDETGPQEDANERLAGRIDDYM